MSCDFDISNNFVSVHDGMMKMAMNDAYNQQDLAHKAKLQVELFQKAQEYAKEVGIQELKAKQYANILNDTTKNAQATRMMMFQLASQVKLLSEETLREIAPIQCNSPRCSMAQLNQFQGPSSLQFNQFMFKQKNNEEFDEELIDINHEKSRNNFKNFKKSNLRPY